MLRGVSHVSLYWEIGVVFSRGSIMVLPSICQFWSMIDSTFVGVQSSLFHITLAINSLAFVCILSQILSLLYSCLKMRLLHSFCTFHSNNLGNGFHNLFTIAFLKGLAPQCSIVWMTSPCTLSNCLKAAAPLSRIIEATLQLLNR